MKQNINKIIITICIIIVTNLITFSITKNYIKSNQTINPYSFELSTTLLEYYYHSQDVFNEIDNFDDKYSSTDAACDMFDCKLKIDSIIN